MQTQPVLPSRLHSITSQYKPLQITFTQGRRGERQTKGEERERRDIPFDRRQPQQPHAIIQHHPRRIIQRHPRLHQLPLTAHNPQMVVARAERMRHLEQIRQDGSGLFRLQRVLYYVRILRDDADQVDGLRLGEEREVCARDVRGAEGCLTGDGAQTGVCVLEVGSGVAFEGGHYVDVEGVVVDSVVIIRLGCEGETSVEGCIPFSAHVLDHNTGYA